MNFLIAILVLTYFLSFSFGTRFNNFRPNKKPKINFMGLNGGSHARANKFRIQVLNATKKYNITFTDAY